MQRLRLFATSGTKDGRTRLWAGSSLRSLRSPNFRRYYAGYMVSETGEWAQRVGQAWLVLELTGSGTWLGVVTGLQLLPVLVLAPWGGLLADAADRRKLLLCTQSMNLLVALLLAVTTQTGVVTVWVVIVLAVVTGSLKAVDHPTRQRFILDMVGEDDLVNALMLHSVLFNVAKVAGPAISGLLVAVVGVSSSFYMNAASYVGVLVALAWIEPAALKSTTRQPRRHGQVREAWRYVVATPEIAAPLVVLTVAGTVVFVWGVTIPILARDVFGGGPRTFGLMFSAMGLGAVVSGLGFAGRGATSVRSFTTSGIALGGLVLCTSTLPSLPLVLVALVLVGGAGTVFRSTGIGIVQLAADERLRGPVVGILGMALLGTTPIGGPLVGLLAETVGIRWVLAGAGTGTVIAALLAATWIKRCAPIEALH